MSHNYLSMTHNYSSRRKVKEERKFRGGIQEEKRSRKLTNRRKNKKRERLQLEKVIKRRENRLS